MLNNLKKTIVNNSLFKNKNFPYNYKLILYLILIIIAGLNIPFIFAFFVSDYLEILREKFLENNITIISVIQYFVVGSSMGFGRIVNALIVGYLLKKVYYQINTALFQKLYFQYFDSKAYVKHLRNSENIILILRLALTLWVPLFFDSIMMIIFSIKNSLKLSFLFLIFYTLQISFLIIMFTFARKLQSTFNNLEEDNKSYLSIITQNFPINFIYNLKEMHIKHNSNQISRNSHNYRNLMYGLCLIEGMATIFNAFCFSGFIYILSTMENVRDKAILFSLLINSYISLWQLLSNFIKLYDVMVSVDFTFLSEKPKQTLPMQNMVNQKLNITYKNKQYQFTNGINILSGACGSGKTQIINKISSEYNNCIVLTQHDYLFENQTILQNIVGSLEVDNEILEKTLAIIGNDFKGNVNQMCKDWSGGELKIIAFLRLCYYVNYHKAIGQQFKIILMDEPFNHVDANVSGLMIQYIKSIQQEYVIVVVDHSQKIDRVKDIKIIQIL